MSLLAFGGFFDPVPLAPHLGTYRTAAARSGPSPLGLDRAIRAAMAGHQAPECDRGRGVRARYGGDGAHGGAVVQMLISEQSVSVASIESVQWGQ